MSVRVGRVFGIPVEVHATWIIIFALLTYTIGFGFIAGVHNNMPKIQALGYGALGALLLFVCLMAHECAHAIVARKAGIRTGVITLFLFGGAAQLCKEPDRWDHELKIALAGPMMSIALAALFIGPYIALPASSVWCTLAFYLAFSNALLGIVNLLPGYPLDGGRVFRAFLWLGFRSRTTATRIATGAGQFIGLASAAFGVYMLMHSDAGGVWLIMIGWYIGDAAAKAWGQEQMRHSLEQTVASDIITAHPAPLSPTETLSSAIRSEHMLAENADLWPVVDQSGPVGVVPAAQAESLPQEMRDQKTVGEVMDSTDHVVMADASENAWDVVERLGERNDIEAAVVAEGSSVIGIVEKRVLPGLLMSRMRAAAH